MALDQSGMLNTTNQHGWMSAWLGVAALWSHLFWSLVPSWRNGEYYEYGYFVPVLAVGLAWRRWKEWPLPLEARKTLGRGVRVFVGVATVLGLVVLAICRVVEIGDVSWRPPLAIHAMLVIVATHLILASRGGGRFSAWFSPVTLLACSAVPLLYQWEQTVVRQLTAAVVATTREIFLLQGMPVGVVGERLVMNGQVCEVTDGCSGIRSVQSLLMVALFFGEWLWLRWPARIALVGVACLAALVTNTGRAWYLAAVQFSKGFNAAGEVHDKAGHLAFGVAAIILYLAARLLIPRQRGKTLVRKVVATP